MHRSTRLLLVLLAVGVTASACRREPPPPPVPAGPTPEEIAERERVERERVEAERRAAEERARLERERMERERVERERAERIAGLRRTMEASVYYDFDRSDLSAETRALLDQKVPILRDHPDLRIRITGHADERGSDAYNMALGHRRAAAAKRYLTQQGIAEARIETTSVGEERPVCTESNEACWWRNRRAEFTITMPGGLAAM